MVLPSPAATLVITNILIKNDYWLKRKHPVCNNSKPTALHRTHLPRAAAGTLGREGVIRFPSQVQTLLCNLISHQEMQIKTMGRSYFIPTRVAVIKKHKVLMV